MQCHSEWWCQECSTYVLDEQCPVVSIWLDMADIWKDISSEHIQYINIFNHHSPMYAFLTAMLRLHLMSVYFLTIDLVITLSHSLAPQFFPAIRICSITYLQKLFSSLYTSQVSSAMNLCRGNKKSLQNVITLIDNRYLLFLIPLICCLHILHIRLPTPLCCPRLQLSHLISQCFHSCFQSGNIPGIVRL